jgi:Arc/MetJ family transcription regulator
MSAEAVDPAGRERKEIQGDPNVGARQARRSSPNLTFVRIRNGLFGMRTTLDIPEELIEEARKLLGFKSKTDTIVLSLRELIRRKRIDRIKEILGSIDLEINLGDSRRRPRRPRSR